MTKAIATCVFFGGIALLFWLEKDKRDRPSVALWLPTVWILIAGSRNLGVWLATFGLARWGGGLEEGNPIDQLFILAIITSCGAILVSRRQQGRHVLLGGSALWLYVAYCGVSILWSDYSDVALRRWIKGFGDMAVVLVLLTEPACNAAVKRVLVRGGFILIPLSVLTIKYYPDIGRSYSGMWYTMYTGVTPQKNSLGLICAIFGLVSLWRLISTRSEGASTARKRQRIAHVAMLGMVVWLLSLADALTATVCLVVGSTVLIVTRYEKGRRPSIVHLLVGSLVGICLFGMFADAGGELVEAAGRSTTLSGRTEIWNLLLPLAGNPLLGVGFESFWLGSRLQQVWEFQGPNAARGYSGLTSAHNGYLGIYLTLGWVGVLLLGTLIVGSYRKVVAILRDDPAMGGLWLALLSVTLIYNLSEEAFRPLQMAWLLLVLVVVAASKGIRNEERAAHRPIIRGERTDMDGAAPYAAQNERGRPTAWTRV